MLFSDYGMSLDFQGASDSFNISSFNVNIIQLINFTIKKTIIYIQQTENAKNNKYFPLK